jgi:hypothetical protein
MAEKESRARSIAKRGLLGEMLQRRLNKREPKPSAGDAMRQGRRGLQDAARAIDKAGKKKAPK